MEFKKNYNHKEKYIFKKINKNYQNHHKLDIILLLRNKQNQNYLQNQ